MSRPRLASILALSLAVAVGAAAAILHSDSSPSPSSPTTTVPPGKRPNFVFVLSDDLSRDLVPYMRNVRAMQREGVSFSRYIVTDSLCCPSRSSIFTGRYPHSTGVVTNAPPYGGFDVFHGRNEERDTFATTLAGQGYATAMMGKYLNGYKPLKAVRGVFPYVPPGWSDWAVTGKGYHQFNYDMVQRDAGRRPTVVHYGKRPQDYLTDVISARGRRFIGDSVKRRKPFMLELATFAPHAPYVPAPRDARKFPHAKVPRGPTFDQPQLRPRPRWLSTQRISRAEIARLDTIFRKRARSVQAIDKMVGDVRAQLTRLGVADNTYVIFSSDNGFHTGQRRLLEGKKTAWDHDIRVPLVIVGPQVPDDATVGRLASNVDLRPTLEALAGASTKARVEGRSLAGFLHGDRVSRWRDRVLIEHHGPDTPSQEGSDPDRSSSRQGDPPSYRALRGKSFTYVRYDAGIYRPEYYDLRRDPNERHNVYSRLSRKRKAELRARLERLHTCSNARSCHAADR